MLVVFGLLATVFARDAFFKVKKNAQFFDNVAVTKGYALDPNVSLALARESKDRFWAVHVWLGYIFCFLLVLRCVSIFESQKKTAPQEPRSLRLLYNLAYGIFIIMALSGLTLNLSANLNLSTDVHDWTHSLHEWGFRFVLGFAVLHLLGVLRAELGKQPGIVSQMIHGKKLQQIQNAAKKD